MLLALHHAAVLLTHEDQPTNRLYNLSMAGASMLYARPSWYPKLDVFFAWLVHHRIAIHVRPNRWAAHPDAYHFANIPNRLRVYRIGKLILEREGHPIEPPRVLCLGRT